MHKVSFTVIDPEKMETEKLAEEVKKAQEALAELQSILRSKRMAEHEHRQSK